jgi:hypothetical protein
MISEEIDFSIESNLPYFGSATNSARKIEAIDPRNTKPPITA